MLFVCGFFMIMALLLFAISWKKLHGNFKPEYKWATLLVPVSLFFDVAPSHLNRWKYTNIFSAVMLPIFIVCFITYLS